MLEMGNVIAEALDTYVAECRVPRTADPRRCRPMPTTAGSSSTNTDPRRCRPLFRDRATQILDDYCINKECINTAICTLIEDIIKQSRELFGMRKQKSAQDQLIWVTAEMLYAHESFLSFQREFRSWPRGRRKEYKDEYIEKEEAFAKVMETGHIRSLQLRLMGRN